MSRGWANYRHRRQSALARQRLLDGWGRERGNVPPLGGGTPIEPGIVTVSGENVTVGGIDVTVGGEDA